MNKLERLLDALQAAYLLTEIGSPLEWTLFTLIEEVEQKLGITCSIEEGEVENANR